MSADRVVPRDAVARLSVQPEVLFHSLEPVAKLVDFGPKCPRLFELAPSARRGQGAVYHGG